MFASMKYLYSAIMLSPRRENGVNPTLSKSVQSYILSHCVDSWPLINRTHRKVPAVFKANTAQSHRLPAVAPRLCINQGRFEAAETFMVKIIPGV